LFVKTKYINSNNQEGKQIEKKEEDEENEKGENKIKEISNNEEDENNFNVPITRNRVSYFLHPPKLKHAQKK
jgi:hypothetical protein